MVLGPKQLLTLRKCAFFLKKKKRKKRHLFKKIKKKQKTINCTESKFSNLFFGLAKIII